jgi:hypothetical protein
MKHILILLLSFTILFANEPTPTQKIQELIIDIKKAPESERFILMNQFKKELRQLNAEARKSAFVSLQHSLQLKKLPQDQQLSMPVNIQLLRDQQQQQNIQLQLQQGIQQQNEMMQKAAGEPHKGNKP